METRPITPDEFPAFHAACESTFAVDPHPADVANERLVFETDRSLAVFDGDAIVGTASAYSFDMSVPGASIPVAGVTYVSVQPTHRRRGVATSLMRRQLDELYETGGEPVAMLWASESPIYGRFGYGLASTSGSVEIELSRSAFVRPVEPAVRPVPTSDLPKLADQAYEHARARRPGLFARDDRWWTSRLYDPEHHRAGSTALRAVVSDDGEGYALYAVKNDWTDSIASGLVNVREVVAATPAAEAAIWRFLCDQDLMVKLVAWNVPADTALFHLLADPRRARMRMKDNLWVRLVDVPAALAQRRYRTEGELVIELADPFCPWNSGRYRLAGGPDGATCEPTDASADVAMSATELGAAYLGGTTLTELAAAGRVDELAPNALRRADTLLSWTPAPWCPQVF